MKKLTLKQLQSEIDLIKSSKIVEGGPKKKALIIFSPYYLND